MKKQAMAVWMYIVGFVIHNNVVANIASIKEACVNLL